MNNGVKWSAPGTNAGCVNRTPPKVGGCQDREKLIVSTSYTFTRGCVAYGFECYPSSGARSGPAMPGGERGKRKRSEEQGRAGQDERTRQTSWAGLGDLLGDLLRGLLVGNSHCWWRAQMQLLLVHQMVPRAPITVHRFH